MSVTTAGKDWKIFLWMMYATPWILKSSGLNSSRFFFKLTFQFTCKRSHYAGQTGFHVFIFKNDLVFTRF